MIVFPNAKINIGLHIIQKRADGFHDIESCFIPIHLRDILEAVPADEFQFHSTGIPIPAENPDNLVVKAYDLLASDYDLNPVAIHLHKVIPMGAGLGGGSSDAAHMLKLLNDLFDLEIPLSGLEQYARKLGSDCAFFIQNRPVLAKGKGDELFPINVNTMNGLKLVLIFPKIHSDTHTAYQGIRPVRPLLSLQDCLNGPPEEWKRYLTNGFEQQLFSVYPVLGEIKQSLYDAGAVYAAMTGSGSALYGLFHSLPDLNVWNKKDYMVYWENISLA
jgi:4-diphosphocytidyl-2-C-methyl-D-erythritol kinase